MLPQAAIILESDTYSEQRGAARKTLKFGFDSLDSREGKRVVILNLSRSGMLVQTSTPLAVGEVIRVELPDDQTAEARVVRDNGDSFGTQFLLPISQATVNRVVLGAPAFPNNPSLDDLIDRRYPIPSEAAPDWLLYALSFLTFLVIVGFLYALMFLAPSF